MNKKNRMLLTAAALATSAMLGKFADAVPVTPGDLVIYRVGTGASGLTGASTAVFIDEYTTAGALVQSIPVATIASGGNQALTSSGTATSEGLLNTSTDGRYVVFSGYGTGTGTASIAGSASTNVARVVGRLDVSTGAIDTSTALSDWATGNNPRSVASTDGSSFYLGGAAGGVRTAAFGATSSTQISASTLLNVRALTLTGGNVNATTSSGTNLRVAQIDNGIPPSSTNTAELSGISGSTGSPYQMFFADTDGSPGIDTLYLADDGGNILKYSLEGSTWVTKGSVTASGVRGLTGSVSGSNVTLFGTTGGSGSNGGGTLYTFTDLTGYNASISGSATALVSLATNSAEAFRGIGIIPNTPEPTSLALMGLGSALLLSRRRSQT